MSYKLHCSFKNNFVDDLKFPKRNYVVFSYAFLIISLLLFQQCFESVNGQFGVVVPVGIGLSYGGYGGYGGGWGYSRYSPWGYGGYRGWGRRGGWRGRRGGWGRPGVIIVG